ncbi:hypothetical protein NLG97_g3192 [Lecanicillium saksenae]|uniref:Uncharacterized protein n=1 Tax=Lecanicillium saksenae TaxID=468837 RepID=A0ACC1R073_9HYPO|nr:hypothetical protein NLG97_g3192 [Lecanicillium saksenae]
MPHKVVQSQLSIRSIGTQAVAQCFCEKQIQGSSCFANLPVHLQTLINEHHASVRTRGECVCKAPPAEFPRFTELPLPVQERIISFCLPAGQVRYLESLGSIDQATALADSKTLPCAAKTNRLFYDYFKKNWRRTYTGTKEHSNGDSPSEFAFVNFSLDKLIIDINRPLKSMSEASYLVQYRSSLRPGRQPMSLNEAWAHDKAETEIRSLTTAFFTEMSHLRTYWLVISDLAITSTTTSTAEPQCRCVFAPMIKCMSDPMSTKCHAFRYHVKTGKITCAEMSRNQELNTLLAACGEKKPAFTARVTFIHGDEKELLDTSDGLDWWHLPAWGLLNFKYEKLKKRLDWGLVADVLQHQFSA